VRRTFFKPYKSHKVQLLTDENKRGRLQRCRQLQRRAPGTRWECILFTGPQPPKRQELVRRGSRHLSHRRTPPKSAVRHGLGWNLRQWQDTTGFRGTAGQNQLGRVPTRYFGDGCTS
ncbi:unnamed protein product, partial [Ixodes hexagonus]